MDQLQFRRHVKDALAHLYDQAYLETDPLADALGLNHPGELRGPALQQILLDAIQALRPTRDLPYSSLAWRRYRYLYLRYAQAVTLAEIGNDLGISLRQARRYNYDALTAVAAFLWDRYGLANGTNGIAPANGAANQENAAVAEEMVNVEEQARETAVPVGELLVGVLATFRPLAARRGVPLTTAIAEGTPVAVVDRAVLRQSLLNVLTLTLEMGSSSLDLVVEPTLDGAVRILVRARIGGDAATLSGQILADERWYIARHLLQAQRGQVELIENSDGRLTVALRVRSMPSAKVLVVEDNLDVIALYHRYLSDSPYQIIASSSTIGTVEVAVAEKPAAILLDVMMPSQDGWEILQLLKCHPEIREIPVLMCSILKERELAIALGAADLLVKPISRPALLQALQRYCPRPEAAHRDPP